MKTVKSGWKSNKALKLLPKPLLLTLTIITSLFAIIFVIIIVFMSVSSLITLFDGSFSISKGNGILGKNANATRSGDVRHMSGLSASQLDEKLTGLLKGHGVDFVQAGEQYGIDPAFLAAISMSETGNGNPNNILPHNNIAGLMGRNGLMQFGSIRESIFYEAKNMKELYIDDGLVSPQQIQKRYAPNGADNDPTGLNSNWLKNVTTFWADFGGLNVDTAYRDSVPVGDGTTFIYPVKEGSITQGYTPFGVNQHKGIDIGVPRGTSVYSSTSGTVLYATGSGGRGCFGGGGGNGIWIDDGSVSIRYYHLRNEGTSISSDSSGCDGSGVLVKAGDTVSIGQMIGYSGTTGQSSGPHLHFEVRDGDTDYSNSISPFSFLPYSLQVGESLKQ